MIYFYFFSEMTVLRNQNKAREEPESWILKSFNLIEWNQIVGPVCFLTFGRRSANESNFGHPIFRLLEEPLLCMQVWSYQSAISHSDLEKEFVFLASARCMTYKFLNCIIIVAIFNQNKNQKTIKFREIAIWNYFPKNSLHKKFSKSFFWKSIWIHMIFDLYLL